MEKPALPFVGVLDTDGLQRFAALGHIRRYPNGASLFREGDPSSTVVVIRSGRVKVTLSTPEGFELVLGLRGPGSLIGELASLSEHERRRSATGVAVAPVSAQVIGNAEFVKFLTQFPPAMLAVTRVIIDRLREGDRRRVEFGGYDILGRVARVLAELASGSDLVTADGVCIDPPLTQHELAGLVGASRESVVRVLAELRHRGLVKTGRRRLVIRDIGSLNRIAHAV